MASPITNRGAGFPGEACYIRNLNEGVPSRLFEDYEKLKNERLLEPKEPEEEYPPFALGGTEGAGASSAMKGVASTPDGIEESKSASSDQEDVFEIIEGESDDSSVSDDEESSEVEKRAKWLEQLLDCPQGRGWSEAKESDRLFLIAQRISATSGRRMPSPGEHEFTNGMAERTLVYTVVGILLPPVIR